MPRLLQRFPGHKSLVGESDLFGSLRREMDRLFEDFTQGFGPASEGGASFGMPTKVDASETGDALTVAMELPGLDEKQVDVTLDRDMLVIKSALISNERTQVPAWLEVDSENLQGSVLALPQRDQIDSDIREQLLVELYSK